MTTLEAAPVGVLRRIWLWLPTTVDRRLRILAWASLAVQTAIVGTGGAVRLTGSGLGCPTWPQCTAESFIPTPEMGMHGLVEFGNRLLSIVVGIVALLMLVHLLRLRRERGDLFALSVLILFGTVVQGVIGGISVRVQLDPAIVGVHFALSAVLVALAAALVWRVRYGPRGERRVAPRWLAPAVHTTSLLVAITVVAGILTTGAGPHAGDETTDRNGLDPELLQHVHSWPAYVLLALTLVVVIGSWRMPPVRRFTIALLAVEFVQIAVGIAQSRMGLPELLVGIHMVLACLLAAAMTTVVLSLRAPAGFDTRAPSSRATQPAAG